jgi:hypothetical protein
MMADRQTYDQVFVRGNERHVTQLTLQVNSQGLDTVAHAVCGSHTRQVLQEVGQGALVWGFLEVLVVAHIALRLNLRELLP